MPLRFGRWKCTPEVWTWSKTLPDFFENYVKREFTGTLKDCLKNNFQLSKLKSIQKRYLINCMHFPNGSIKKITSQNKFWKCLNFSLLQNMCVYIETYTHPCDWHEKKTVSLTGISGTLFNKVRLTSLQLPLFKMEGSYKPSNLMLLQMKDFPFIIFKTVFCRFVHPLKLIFRNEHALKVCLAYNEVGPVLPRIWCSNAWKIRMGWSVSAQRLCPMTCSLKPYFPSTPFTAANFFLPKFKTT